MTTRLATPDDLTRRMGITVESERALELLADASAAVISYTGQQFVRATTTVQVRVPSDWKVRLGQLPVHDVDAVTDLNDNQLLFTFDGIDTVHVTVNLDSFSFEPWTSPIRTVNVTYDHGFDAIPDDIVAVVCQVAGRAYGTAPQDTGAAREQLGDWSYSAGAAASSGALGLLLPERAVLDRYTQRVRTIGIGP